MPHDLAIAVAAGLGGMFGWGLADFFAKKAIDQLGYVVSLVWAHGFGTLFFASIAVLDWLVVGEAPAVPDLSTVGLLAAFGALQALIYFLVYRGFGKGQLALLNPVFASFSGVTAVLSIALFGETTTAGRVAGLATIFAGVVLISIDVDALRTRRISLGKVPGLKEIALATLLAAFWTLSWGRVVEGNDWVSYALIMYAFMTIGMVVGAKLARADLRIRGNAPWTLLLLIGLCETVAYLAISLGYSHTRLISVVAVLSGAFSLPTVILARALLKERTTVAQAIGGFAIVIGTVLLPLQ